MSTPEIERLARDCSTDQALRGKIAAGDTGEAVQIARAAGYDVTADEVKAKFAGEGEAELSSRQLDAVAGGAWTTGRAPPTR
jgi:predicted ribosomally synthesized peptide with nif11-like leader